MFSKIRHCAFTAVLPGALALLLGAGPAQAQCRGGGQSPGGMGRGGGRPQNGMLTTMRQQRNPTGIIRQQEEFARQQALLQQRALQQQQHQLMSQQQLLAQQALLQQQRQALIRQQQQLALAQQKKQEGDKPGLAPGAGVGLGLGKPDNPPAALTDEQKAAAIFKLAMLLQREGQSADAAEFCNRIIAQYPQTGAAGEAQGLLQELNPGSGSFYAPGQVGIYKAPENKQ